MASDHGPRTLGDYFTLHRGTTYQGRLRGQPGPVLLGLASIQRNGGFRRDSIKTYGGDSPRRLLVRPGELYLSLKDVTQSADLLGAVARMPLDLPSGRLTQDTVRLEPKTANVPLGFLYWLLRTPQYRGYCRAHATGTTNLGLPRDDFLAFPVPEPTSARVKLAATLEVLDEKIELNRRMSETLETAARALFNTWFVDLDPVLAKAAGRDPGLPRGIADPFPDGLETSDGAELPAGWRIGSVYEIADVVYGAPFASSLFNAEQRGEPLLRIRDLPSESPGVWTTESLDRGYRVRPGDIVVGMDGEFRAHLWGGAEAWLNQRLCVFRPTDGYSAAFVRSSIMAPLAEVEATETATTVIHLGKSDIDRFRVAVPPRPIVETFNAVGQPLYDRVVAAKQESRTLTSIRDSLLPRLISGELRLKDVDQLVEAVSA